MNLQEAKNFLGIELKDRSVRVLFKKCIPSEGTHSVESALLFTRAFGYHKDQDPVFFDTDKLKENKEYILFLIGQLREFPRFHALFSDSQYVSFCTVKICLWVSL